jgi:hypothetical protein
MKSKSVKQEIKAEVRNTWNVCFNQFIIDFFKFQETQ